MFGRSGSRLSGADPRRLDAAQGRMETYELETKRRGEEREPRPDGERGANIGYFVAQP